jgi:hypothetical protein
VSKSWAEMKVLVVSTNTRCAGMCKVGASGPLLM